MAPCPLLRPLRLPVSPALRLFGSSASLRLAVSPSPSPPLPSPASLFSSLLSASLLSSGRLRFLPFWATGGATPRGPVRAPHARVGRGPTDRRASGRLRAPLRLRRFSERFALRRESSRTGCGARVRRAGAACLLDPGARVAPFGHRRRWAGKGCEGDKGAPEPSFRLRSEDRGRGLRPPKGRAGDGTTSVPLCAARGPRRVFGPRSTRAQAPRLTRIRAGEGRREQRRARASLL